MNTGTITKWPVVRKNRYGKVTIYRQVREDKAHYTVSWRNGRNRFRETRVDVDEAFDRAAEVLSAFEAGKTPQPATKRTDKWKHLLGDVPLEKLYECYAERNNLTLPVAIEKVVEEFLAVKRARQVCPAYIRALRYQLKQFMDFTGKSIALRDVTTKQINQYLLAIEHPSTRNNHRGGIKSLFTFARKQRYLPQNMLTAADDTEAIKLRPKSPELFTAEELEKLLEAANWKETPYLIAAAYAGIRNAEINRLQWSDVLWEENAFVLRPEITKTSRTRIAYFPPHVAGGLKAIARLAELKGLKKLVPRQILHLIPDLQKRSGVVWKKNGMRKTYISSAMTLTRNAAELAEQCGNSVEMIQRIYKGLITKDAAEKWFQAIDDAKISAKLP